MLTFGAAVLLILLAGAWLGLYYRHHARYRLWSRIPVSGLKLQKWLAPGLHLLERTSLLQRAPTLYYRTERSVQKLHGLRFSREKTLLVLAEAMSYGWAALIAGSSISLLTGESIGMIVGVLLGGLLPISMLRDLERKVIMREQDIVMELPELLNKLVLLVGAGETVQKALLHCCHRADNNDTHPLYVELRMMVSEWEGGHSFQEAFEQFSRRCAVQEISVFTTTVLLHFKRGGSDFVLALRDLSRVLWEKRKAIARTRGEQASSKLVFPMVVIFLVVLVLIGAPALMMINI